jgi:hypothetical protein
VQVTTLPDCDDITRFDGTRIHEIGATGGLSIDEDFQDSKDESA